MPVLQGNPKERESLRTLLYALWEGKTKPEELCDFLSRFYGDDFSLLEEVAEAISYIDLLLYLHPNS